MKRHDFSFRGQSHPSPRPCPREERGRNDRPSTRDAFPLSPQRGEGRGEGCGWPTTSKRGKEVLSLPFFLLLGCSLMVSLFANAEEKPVSYYRELVPIFKRSCTGCHHPGKLKGELDLTTYEAFLKGGKHGPGFKAGDLKASTIIEEIGGGEPSKPKQ